MKNIAVHEKLLCLLVILVSLVILALMLISPAIFLDANPVYQGF